MKPYSEIKETSKAIRYYRRNIGVVLGLSPLTMVMVIILIAFLISIGLFNLAFLIDSYF